MKPGAGPIVRSRYTSYVFFLWELALLPFWHVSNSIKTWNVIFCPFQSWLNLCYLYLCVIFYVFGLCSGVRSPQWTHKRQPDLLQHEPGAEVGSTWRSSRRPGLHIRVQVSQQRWQNLSASANTPTSVWSVAAKLSKLFESAADQ